jgi:ABC-type lipoprotein release transport system permease subunit
VNLLTIYAALLWLYPPSFRRSHGAEMVQWSARSRPSSPPVTSRGRSQSICSAASYVVGLRMRGIGIRVALGADRRAIGRLVLLQGSMPVVTGIVIGIGLALWASRFVAALVFEVSPWDPLTFITVTLVLASLALVASYVPARRAARLDPVQALRHD